ncbi:MAG: hypothetical protein LBC99_09970 [Spirochaetota bacterium]|jgi:hypothetical protein|nr:hypothetical protein [Spirochaetota bacterium]
MRKPLDDYMNDPDIIDEPMSLREIHAIRLMIHDETKDMTSEERAAYIHEGAVRAMAGYDVKFVDIVPSRL